MNLDNVFHQLFEQILQKFWWVIPLYIAVVFFKAFRPKVKGKIGECIVNFNTRLHLNGRDYRLIKDVTIPSGNGQSTQIDHVVVSPYGVFVIETKNYSGWIFGGADDSKWTSVHFRRKFSFQNPLRQNYAHICALSSLLNIPNTHIHGIVRFIGDARFKTGIPEGVFTKGHIRYIESFNETVFTDEEVCAIIQRIEAGRFEPGRETNRMHVRGLRSRDKYASVASENANCPQCGSPMVLRTARRGPSSGNSFWGCPRYPDCRGTRPA